MASHELPAYGDFNLFAFIEICPPSNIEFE